MSGHTLEPGRIVVFGEWVGSEYVEYQAYVRVVNGDPETFHVSVNLSYNDGSGPAVQANNVDNIEAISGNVDYWRYLTQPETERPFETNYRPSQGEIVWLAHYDATDGEHYFYLAFVRALVGAPTDTTPRLNLSYYNTKDGTDQNANTIDPVEEAGATDDYWFKVALPE